MLNRNESIGCGRVREGVRGCERGCSCVGRGGIRSTPFVVAVGTPGDPWGPQPLSVGRPVDHPPASTRAGHISSAGGGQEGVRRGSGG
eukprot:942822-Prorocentrum_minimum.AAC.1